jgi:hypothetical protein
MPGFWFLVWGWRGGASWCVGVGRREPQGGLDEPRLRTHACCRTSGPRRRPPSRAGCCAGSKKAARTRARASASAAAAAVGVAAAGARRGPSPVERPGCSGGCAASPSRSRARRRGLWLCCCGVGRARGARAGAVVLSTVSAGAGARRAAPPGRPQGHGNGASPCVRGEGEGQRVKRLLGDALRVVWAAGVKEGGETHSLLSAVRPFARCWWLRWAGEGARE